MKDAGRSAIDAALPCTGKMSGTTPSTMHHQQGQQGRGPREQDPGRVRPPRREPEPDSRDTNTPTKRNGNQGGEATAPIYPSISGCHQPALRWQGPYLGMLVDAPYLGGRLWLQYTISLPGPLCLWCSQIWRGSHMERRVSPVATFNQFHFKSLRPGLGGSPTKGPPT